MPGISEEMFSTEDPRNPGYSLTEYDLHAKLGLTIRRNIRDDRYEIVVIKTKKVRHSVKTIELAIAIANQLEKEENTWLKDKPGSPDDPLNLYRK